LNRRFIGADVDEAAVRTTLARLWEIGDEPQAA